MDEEEEDGLEEEVLGFRRERERWRDDMALVFPIVQGKKVSLLLMQSKFGIWGIPDLRSASSLGYGQGLVGPTLESRCRRLPQELITLRLGEEISILKPSATT